MIDTHAHLYLCKSPETTLLERAKAAGLTAIINVGLDIETSIKAVNVHSPTLPVYGTLGIHPCESLAGKERLSELKEVAALYPFKAIGEIGLDYYREYAPHEVQIEVFEAQLALAQDLHLPVIIHNREADEDVIRIVNQFPDVPKVFHCFSADLSFIDAVFNESTFFSFTGNITYDKKGEHSVAALKSLPLDRIMTETDCPYLTPQSLGRIENQPAHVTEVARVMANLRGISLDQLIQHTTSTALTFFKV